MHKSFNRLAQEIKELTGDSEVYYLANPGNWGDALIRFNTLKFFRDNNINFKEINLTNRKILIELIFSKRNKTLIYGGGGGWCDNWNIGYPIVKSKLKYFKQAIILPSTYEKEFSLKNTIFYRRDNYESKINMSDSEFCHDMAFYWSPIIDKKEHLDDEAFFFRTDIEGRKLWERYPNNTDITKDKNQFDDIAPFISEILKYKKINTDKLHIAILAAKLNKEVDFYSGNYFKNKAVFLSSMKDYFPKVNFFE